ncbi:NlpC/P60 family protein [Shewanella surugensis]|uniref:NlpC/P60 family protein n=1 Tax=Shewanella surugensis TaxID=212020 RepID=A0ABT0LFG3_9GAMM|nr:NlpC/P60 family protein [Shewanella surugensis]MCL1126438.1 NlpC/P60 family protein [Shewanella surugensis]
MHWINQYMSCPYVDCGRDLNYGLDCWGLVRDVLQKQFGVPLLASFGMIYPDDKTGMTQGFKHVVKTFKPQKGPVAGSVATGFSGSNLIHVGVCVESNGLKVLHTSRRHGPSSHSVTHFQRLFHNVVYYHYDSNNSSLSK